MDLDSFIPLYNNLRGLELLRPRFEVSIDRLIPTLDFISLDIEYLNERTLLSGRHINHFNLDSRLRRIHPQVMTSDSRCYLIHFIIKNYQCSVQSRIFLNLF